MKLLHTSSFGTPEGTRTPNIQNRNLTLYPIELRTHISFALRYYNRFFPLCKEEISPLIFDLFDDFPLSQHKEDLILKKRRPRNYAGRRF